MAAITTAVDTAGPTGSEEVHVAPSLPLTTKLKYGAAAYAITKLIMNPVNFINGIKTDYFGSSPNKPDVIKAFPSRPQLPVRYVALSRFLIVWPFSCVLERLTNKQRFPPQVSLALKP